MQKKRLAVLFAISVFAALGYMAWSMTPLGTTSIAHWLVKKWEGLLTKEGKSIDTKYALEELKNLTYPEHELLLKLTWLEPHKLDVNSSDPKNLKKMKRYTELIGQFNDSKIMERADLVFLENIILPG